MLKNNAQYMEMVLSLANKYSYDEQHAMTVERLVVKLFERLNDLHNLGESELNLLRHGALLHDIGIYISLKKHHKNSAYLVLHDQELKEYPVKEREMLAVLVRNHRKSVRLPDSNLSRQKHKVLSKLIALLRIADVLDYYHHGKASIEDVIIEDYKCIIKVSGINLVEIKERLGNKSAYFKKVFGLKALFVEAVEEDITFPKPDAVTVMPEKDTEGDIVIEQENNRKSK